MIIIQIVLDCKHAEVRINSCGNERQRRFFLLLLLLSGLNSVRPPLGDNICTTLLGPKLNNSVEFAPFSAQTAFSVANGACYHSQLASSPLPLSVSLSLSLASQIIIGLHFLAS